MNAFDSACAYTQGITIYSTFKPNMVIVAVVSVMRVGHAVHVCQSERHIITQYYLY